MMTASQYIPSRMPPRIKRALGDLNPFLKATDHSQNAALAPACPCLAVEGDSACMDNSNPTACFEGLRALLRNTSAFWYGSDYQTLCPNGTSTENPLCANNGNPAVADSIASRMLGSQNYDLSTINTILNVSFSSPPGKRKRTVTLATRSLNQPGRDQPQPGERQAATRE